MKILLVLLFFLTALNARENPFFPSEGEKDIPYTSNEDTTIAPLKNTTISLPPQARVLQSVTIQYKNLDGSQESKSIQLENSVDWHLPIFISQSITPVDTTQKESAKAEIANTKAEVDTTKKKIEAIKPESKKDEKYKEIASIEYVTFSSSEKNLKITTNDKIIRNFLLVQPHRIVIDFQRDSNIKSYEKDIADNVFTKIRIGNHDQYYRVVIELDGYYRYKMKSIDNGYTLQLI